MPIIRIRVSRRVVFHSMGGGGAIKVCTPHGGWCSEICQLRWFQISNRWWSPFRQRKLRLGGSHYVIKIRFLDRQSVIINSRIPLPSEGCNKVLAFFIILYAGLTISWNLTLSLAPSAAASSLNTVLVWRV